MNQSNLWEAVKEALTVDLVPILEQTPEEIDMQLLRDYPNLIAGINHGNNKTIYAIR